MERCRDEVLEENTTKIPYGKIRSLTVELYHMIQKSQRYHIDNGKFKEVVEFFEEILIKILNHFENKNE